jgi:hypothetical protein
MQTINNTLLNIICPSGTTQINSPWRNVSNFVASSIQVAARNASTGVPATLPSGASIWIEVSNDPNVLTDNLTAATQIAAPSAPVLTAFTPTSAGHGQSPNAGGGDQAFTYPAATYGVKLTYVNLQGETGASAATTLAVAAGKTISVAAPGPDAGGYATAYNVYVSVNSGPYVLQNPPFNSGQTFGNLAVATGPISVNQAFMLYAWQNNLIVPPAANTTGTPSWGTNITGNLNVAAVTGTDNEAAISYDTVTGLFGGGASYTGSPTSVMWSPSCLYFNYVRVCVKGGDGTTNLQVYLFGQNG